jgi:hypothetical protein
LAISSSQFLTRVAWGICGGSSDISHIKSLIYNAM